MALEQYANLLTTTLNGSINNSVTSITVTTGSVFPSIGNFRLLIDSEILLCTARSTNTLTITRAQESTSAASHADLAPVTLILTAGSLEKIHSDLMDANTLASRPAAGKNGTLYLPSDTNYIYRDNGSTWTKMHGLHKFVQPVLGDFTWLNQGGATTDTTKGGISVNVPIAAALNLRVLHKSKTPPYKVTAFFILNNTNFNYQSCGLGFYDPTGGKLVTIHLITTTSFTENVWEVCNWNSATSFNSTAAAVVHSSAGFTQNWLQVEHNGTNLIFRYSNDGYNWLVAATLGKTAFMANDPTKVLFYGRNDTGVIAHVLDLLSWKEE